MVRLLASARFVHNGQRLNIDEEFETDAANAADLVSMGMAREPKGLLSRMMSGAGEQVARRNYRRRDMKAEGSKDEETT